MVQEPSVATPWALVVWLVPVSTEPATGASNVTATPGTGLPNASVIRTDGMMDTARDTTVNWKASDAGKIVAAAPIWPVADTVIAGRLVTVSVRVWIPTFEPSVQVMSAWPLAAVVTELGDTDPPPCDSVAADTTTPPSAPSASLVLTVILIGSGLPTPAT